METLFAEIEQMVVGYESGGSANGRPVLLLHGWPDDVRAWDAVVSSLASKGWRTIAPYLRGFGATRFKDQSILRTGQMTAMALDVVQLLDALKIERVTLAGHDWGARIGYTVAALWPERIERLVVLSAPYETGIVPGSKLNYQQQRAFWYQWFFGSQRGREALRDNRRKLCRYLWQSWSPTLNFTEDQFARTAQSWDNPDWVEITVHSYRVRWGNAPEDPYYHALETQMNGRPGIKVPTVHLQGGADGANLADCLKDQSMSFSAGYELRLIPGVGHFIPRECPEAVVNSISAIN